MRVNEDLLKRLKVGDEKAFEDLYWTYSPQVYNFINSLLFDKSLAEDLTQNVFLKIWEKHEQIERVRDHGLPVYDCPAFCF